MIRCHFDICFSASWVKYRKEVMAIMSAPLPLSPHPAANLWNIVAPEQHRPISHIKPGNRCWWQQMNAESENALALVQNEKWGVKSPLALMYWISQNKSDCTSALPALIIKKRSRPWRPLSSQSMDWNSRNCLMKCRGLNMTGGAELFYVWLDINNKQVSRNITDVIVPPWLSRHLIEQTPAYRQHTDIWSRLYLCRLSASFFLIM